MSTQKVAVVTGANKGIGYAIVKGLCENFKGIVYLTARNEERGKAAIAKLKALGLSPSFHQLDITDQTSVDRFRDHIKNGHGGLDILINNAGIYELESKSFGEEAEQIVEVNYFGTLRVCEALFPLLRTNARVVNVSSDYGRLNVIPSTSLRAKFSDSNLTIEGLNQLMRKYVKDAKDGTYRQEGWGTLPYKASKVGLSALTIIQQRNFNKEVPNRNISANHVHPGYVDTDMSHHQGPLTIEQGAKAPLYLALHADNVKGKYVWYDCRIVDWYGN